MKLGRTSFNLLASVALALTVVPGWVWAQPADQRPTPALEVSPAVDGLLAAFKVRPLVGIGDRHNIAELGALYVALIEDPRFATEVGNLVVEFGGAARQDVIDRYVAGEAVSPKELRNVWSDVVGWEPGELGQMYVDVFAAVRRANSRLPRTKQIKVWLGEPPIDWRKIHRQEDLWDLMGSRDSYPSRLILEKVLSRGRKALVIYGGLHFFSPPPMPTSIKELVERQHPDAFYVVTVYDGLETPMCSARFEAQTRNWPIPALAAPIRGSWIEAGLRDPDCAARGATVILPPGLDDPNAEARQEAFSGVLSNGLLYLGPATGLHTAPTVSAEYNDEAYLAEMARRKGLLAPPEPGSKAP